MPMRALDLGSNEKMRREHPLPGLGNGGNRDAKGSKSENAIGILIEIVGDMEISKHQKWKS